MRAADIEANKALYFRFVTLLGEDNLEALDELLASGFVDHGLPVGTQPGAAGLRDLCASLLARLSDVRLTLEDLIGEGDRVVGRVLVRGTSPTGQAISMEVIDIVRIAQGRIVERWSQQGGCNLLGHRDMPRRSADARAPETEPWRGSVIWRKSYGLDRASGVDHGRQTGDE